MATKLACVAVVLACVLASAAAQDCCAGNVFAMNQTRICNGVNCASVEGVNFAYFAVDLTTSNSFYTTHNSTTGPHDTWFRMVSGKPMGYVMVGAHCYSFAAPTVLFDSKAYCVGPNSNYPIFAASATIGTATAVSTYSDLTGTNMVSVTTGTCIPVAATSETSVEANFNFNHNPDLSLFNLPAACAHTQARHLATVEERDAVVDLSNVRLPFGITL